MKKYDAIIYYLSPFIFTPLVMLFCCLIAEFPGVKTYMYGILCVISCLYTVVMALFSRSPHVCDYLLTLLIPLSAFVTMFFVGFFDQTETRSRFDIEHAIQTAIQLPGCFLYLCMAATAFIASHKNLRIQKRSNL